MNSLSTVKVLNDFSNGTGNKFNKKKAITNLAVHILYLAKSGCQGIDRPLK